ncbi:MAG: DMT family transporter [Saprospiraceae bacterium]|nr:DMT family transporter [Saprospiraceae bacterium]
MTVTTRRAQFIGIALALAGALLFSTKAVLVKLAYLHEVDTVVLLFLRMGFALPFYVVAAAQIRSDEWTRLKGLPTKSWLGVFLAGALGYYLSSLLDFLGLQYIDASVERLILFIYPTIIAILAVLFLKEKVTKLQGLALAISYGGLVFVFGDQLGNFSITDDFWNGSLLILACAFTFAAFLVMSQWLIKPFGVRAFTAFSMIVACLVVCLHFLATSDWAALQHLPWQVYLYAIIMAIFATVLPSYLVNMAIQRIGAIRMAIVSSIGPFSTITLAYLLLDERLTVNQLLGALLIVVGVTVVSIERKKKS